MVLNIVNRLFPYAAGVETADWYINLKELYDRQRRYLLTISISATILILIAFLVLQLRSGRLGITTIIGWSAVILMATVLVVLLFRGVQPFYGSLVLLMSVVGLVLGFAMPGAHHIYLLVFFVFPLQALVLKPVRSALVWISTVFVVAVWFVVPQGLLEHLFQFPRYDSDRLLMGAGAYLLITAIGVVNKIQQRQYIERTVRAFCIDELTSCPKRNILAQSLDPNRYYLFAIVDIENLSELHGVFGPALSDKLLMELSMLLRSSLEGMESEVFKLHRAEFGVLVPVSRPDVLSGTSILEKLSKRASRMVLRWEGAEIRLNIRIGGVLIDQGGSSDFLAKANLALNQSRDEMNPYTLYAPRTSVFEKNRESIDSFGILVRNLEEGLLTVHYQPLVSSVSSEIEWYESLLRIKSPGGALALPGPFLEIAETTGMIEQISNYVLEESVAAILTTGKNISVNITMRDMHRPEFLSRVKSVQERIGNSPGRLILEIVEIQELADLEGCLQFIQEVHDMGCLVALDDFGAGYANFSSLLRLPLDFVKIDGSLVKQVEREEKTSNLLDGVIGFCKKSGIRIVAEYVEEESTARLLRQRGVDYLQGHLFGEAGGLDGIGAA